MNFGPKLIHNCVKAMIGGNKWVLNYRGKSKCKINPNWCQIFPNFLVLMTNTPGTMRFKIFWPKNMWSPWSRGKDSWLWIERSGVRSPIKPQDFFYTPFLTILHTVYRLTVNICSVKIANRFIKNIFLKMEVTVASVIFSKQVFPNGIFLD